MYLSDPTFVPVVVATNVAADGWLCIVESRILGSSIEEEEDAITISAGLQENLSQFLKALSEIPVDRAKQAVRDKIWKPNMRQLPRDYIRQLKLGNNLLSITTPKNLTNSWNPS